MIWGVTVRANVNSFSPAPSGVFSLLPAASGTWASMVTPRGASRPSRISRCSPSAACTLNCGARWRGHSLGVDWVGAVGTSRGRFFTPRLYWSPVEGSAMPGPWHQCQHCPLSWQHPALPSHLCKHAQQSLRTTIIRTKPTREQTSRPCLRDLVSWPIAPTGRAVGRTGGRLFRVPV